MGLRAVIGVTGGCIRVEHLTLKDLLQLFDNGIAHVGSASIAADILGPDTAVNGVLDGLLDGIGLLWKVKRVPAHHGDRENGTRGVDDTLARDIGCRTCFQSAFAKHLT